MVEQHLCVAVSVFVSVSFIWADGSANGARAVCDEPVHRYGEVTNTVPVQHTFSIRNVGEGLLKLERVQAGCGCTHAQISGSPVPPGGTGSVEVAMSLAGREGRRTIAVLLYTDDPVNKVLPLRLDGVALPSGARSAPSRQPALLPALSGGSPAPSSDRRPVDRAVVGKSGPERMTETEIAVVPHNLVLADPVTGQPRMCLVVLRSPKAEPFRVVAIRTNLAAERIVRQQDGSGWVRYAIGPFDKDEIPADAFLIFETDLRGGQIACVSVQGGT
jgi:hypothetical protein